MALITTVKELACGIDFAADVCARAGMMIDLGADPRAACHVALLQVAQERQALLTPPPQEKTHDETNSTGRT